MAAVTLNPLLTLLIAGSSAGSWRQANAELEAARCADGVLGLGDRDELLNWFIIWGTITVMRLAPRGLPH